MDESKARYFADPKLSTEEVLEQSDFERSGVLTDRELRWIVHDVRAECRRFDHDFSADNPLPVGMQTLADSARLLVELLDHWREQLTWRA